MFNSSQLKNLKVIKKDQIFILSYQNYDAFYQGSIGKIGIAIRDLIFKELVDEFLVIEPEFYPGWPYYCHQ